MLMNPADASMSISISYLIFLQVNWFVLNVEYSGSKLGISVQIPFAIGLIEHVYTVQYFFYKFQLSLSGNIQWCCWSITRKAQLELS